MHKKKNLVPPSVTDSDFTLRVPMFITVYGHVLYTIGMDKTHTYFLELGVVRRYRRHGSFELLYAGDNHAVIKHVTLSGKEMYLFVPERKWLAVSNGSYVSEDTNYKAAQEYWVDLKDKPRLTSAQIFIIERIPTAPESGAFNQELYDKYHVLFDGFNGYWKVNFAESVQEDVDPHTFQLGARIRYGLSCVLDGRPIPEDCMYTKLAEEVDSWIQYRENPL